MKKMPNARRGFTLLELLVVITIIAILAAALFPLFGMIRRKMQESLAKNTMGTLTMALEKYRADWNAFPPDDAPSSNGSEMIWFYLTRVLSVGDGAELHYGPYIKVQDNQLTEAPNGGNRKFLSPLGGEYEYVLLVNSDGQKRQYRLVNPGRDKKLGGTLNPTSGFNVESAQDAADNIYSTVEMSQYNK